MVTGLQWGSRDFECCGFDLCAVGGGYAGVVEATPEQAAGLMVMLHFKA